jgi:thiol-disulfide isomerase/thioredoxin
MRKMVYAMREKMAGRRKYIDSLKKSIDSLIYPNVDLNNEDLYKRSAAYRDWVADYLNEIYKTKYKSDTTFKKLYIKDAVPVGVVLGEIQNPFIRDYECYQNASDIIKQTKDPGLINEIYQDFNAAVVNPYYRGKMQQVYDNYRRLQTAGTAAPDFTYTSVDGKPITLSKLRGKYVYIDIWATYCVPCKKEIPFLAKLEEELKGKNIQFVSISVDKQAQAGSWRKYVNDNKLTGYQVMADKDFQSDFIEKFNIAMIPRFILIDPEGNVVDSDGKRPSDPGVKKQLDELLK